MFARKRRDPLWLKVLRGLLRVACIIFLVIYIFFFVGEGDFSCFETPYRLKTLQILFLPGLFAVALIVSFFKERLSGFLMVFSVILYNLCLWLEMKEITWPPSYLALAIIGLGFILLSKLSKRYGYYSSYYHNRYMG